MPTDMPLRRRSRGGAARIAAPARLAASARPLLLLALLLGACTTVLVRAPVAEADLDAARPYGIDVPFLRLWGDALSRADAQEIVALRSQAYEDAHGAQIARGELLRTNSLALSGGGPDGAFGAGLLAGWTERGDRPEFQLVSGVSTGAIIALFAFLGPAHDATLREIYTTYDSDDLFTRTIFTGLLRGTALLDTSGYRALIEAYVTDEVVAEIAAGHARGWLLLIGTTNIDASRPVIWNIGAIAASGHPDARRLIHDVIQASSAIPAAFPPVLIPVETPAGRRDEMHVDGGATQQVILYSPSLRTADIDRRTGARTERNVYVVINNKLEKPYDPVRPRLAAIAGKAASSLIGGSGSGDLYRIFAVARRDGLDLNVTAIPTEFDVESTELFDPAYMGALYRLGYETGLAGDAWLPHPPDYLPRDAPSE